MKEIKCSENESVALAYLGKSFIKVPRSIMDRLSSNLLVERQMARLHLCLFGLCYYTDGYVMLGNNKVDCRRGEYVGTQVWLAEMAGISIGSMSRLISKMVELRLITINHIQGGSRILVNGYADFTWVQDAREAREDNPKTNVAAQMAEAEKRIGGRSMQYFTNDLD